MPHPSLPRQGRGRMLRRLRRPRCHFVVELADPSVWRETGGGSPPRGKRNSPKRPKLEKAIGQDFNGLGHDAWDGSDYRGSPAMTLGSRVRCARPTVVSKWRRYFFNCGGVGENTLKLSPSELALPDQTLR